jgi:hypothetical protein
MFLAPIGPPHCAMFPSRNCATFVVWRNGKGRRLLFAACLTVIAGWLGNRFAAIAIVMVIFAAQATLAVPEVMAGRRLTGLPPCVSCSALALSTVALRVVLVGAVFYFIGWALRGLVARRP